MKLIFIRHGEPNYEIDSLTEKGWREAELLSKRTVKWNVTDFYCSPLGRAKDTASFTLKNAGREAEILPWLREFDAPVLDPETGKRRIPWDFLPDVLDANRDLYDNNLWTKNPIMQTGNMDENYHFVTDGLDALLARYGYVRDGYRYHASDETNREAVIVCFCHLGVTCVALPAEHDTGAALAGHVPGADFRHDRRNRGAQTGRGVLPLPDRRRCPSPAFGGRAGFLLWSV